MKITTPDYFLARFGYRSTRLLRWLADWETRWLSAELASCSIDRPLFVTGLARSGTTLLLELLASVEGVATHRYRDFPFLMTPYLWDRYLDCFPNQEQPVERPHRDGIQITRESPEAMEEPLWQAFFPQVHSAGGTHRLKADQAEPDFDRFYLDHLRKMLLLRQGDRYVAKANYHIPRMEYLARLLPDARFVIPVRDPRTHVQSLVRQHQLFSDYAAADPRVPRYLEAAGHFEFGPQRIPIRIDDSQGNRILEAWSRGDNYLGYAIQWAEVYGFVETLRRASRDLADRILVVRYEDLCGTPDETMRHILDFAQLEPAKAARLFESLPTVSKASHAPALTSQQEETVAAEVESVADLYGYELRAAALS